LHFCPSKAVPSKQDLQFSGFPVEQDLQLVWHLIATPLTNAYPFYPNVHTILLLASKVQDLHPVPQLMYTSFLTIAFYPPVDSQIPLIKLLSLVHYRQLLVEVQERQFFEHYKQFDAEGK
jgi:hypothetical protein